MNIRLLIGNAFFDILPPRTRVYRHGVHHVKIEIRLGNKMLTGQIGLSARRLPLVKTEPSLCASDFLGTSVSFRLLSSLETLRKNRNTKIHSSSYKTIFPERIVFLGAFKFACFLAIIARNTVLIVLLKSRKIASNVRQPLGWLSAQNTSKHLCYSIFLGRHVQDL